MIFCRLVGFVHLDLFCLAQAFLSVVDLDFILIQQCDLIWRFLCLRGSSLESDEASELEDSEEVFWDGECCSADVCLGLVPSPPPPPPHTHTHTRVSCRFLCKSFCNCSSACFFFVLFFICKGSLICWSSVLVGWSSFGAVFFRFGCFVGETCFIAELVACGKGLSKHFPPPYHLYMDHGVPVLYV